MSERFAGSDSSPSTLIERIRSVPRETFRLRLLAWSAAVAGASLAVLRVVVGPAAGADRGLLAAALAIGLCSGLGLSAYCFARFVLGASARSGGGDVRFLLASAAFSALGFGSMLQAVADFRRAEPGPQAWITTSSWLAAAVLFAGAAYSETVWRRSSRYESLQQFVLAVIAVLAFPFAAAPYAFDASLLCSFGGMQSQAFTAVLVNGTAGFAATVLTLLALLGMLRRAGLAKDETGDDRFAGLLCYFLAPCVFGLLLRTASSERFDGLWRSGEIVRAGAWLALIVRAGIENAFAHRESSDRLRELDTLHQVSWSLVGAGTVRELMNLFVDTLVDKVGARIAAIYLADDAGENLELAAISGCDDPRNPVGTVYPLASANKWPGFHSGHTADAFRSGEMRIARDVFIDVEFVPWRQVAVDDPAAASFPLLRQGKAVGVLNIYFSDRLQLNTQRIKLISTIATAATPAIEYARARERGASLGCDCPTAEKAA